MRKFFALLAAMAIAACATPDDRQPEPAVATAPAELVTAFGPGSLIIPMDTTYQDAGMLRAFGLVYRLLQSNVPVHWVVLTGKADQGIDFTITAPSTVRTRTAAGAGAAVALPASYRGGPFVIAAADAAAALPIIAAWKSQAADVATPTTVHELTAGSFSADVQRTLTAAPKIAVFQDGAEAIAYADLNAAGIPDSTGAAWATGSVDELSENELVGPTGDGNTGGSGGDGVLNAGGTQNYCHITSMHWDGSPNGAAATNEVVREVRTWLDGSATTHGFMQCAAIATFENSPRGRFITTAGVVEDTNATLPEAGQSLVNRIPDELVAQYHGPIAGDSGTIGSIGLNGGGSDYRANTEILINQGNASTALANAARVMWASGYLDGDTTNGRLTYLAGHNFSVTTPVSANAQTNGVRLLLNSIFESPCAVATGQPNLTLTKAAPATTAGNTITFTLNYANTGNAPAYNAVLTDVLPAGTTFNAASNGGTVAAGTVTWNLGTLAIGATGSVTLTVNVSADGTYANSATLAYRAGTTPRSVTSNTTSTSRDADVPVANPDTFTVAEDSSTALNVRANDTGLGDTPIVTTIAAAPANGTATVNLAGTIQYTPNPNFTGTDTFQYTITDSTNQSSTATVTVTVTPVNDPPTAANDAVTVAEDGAATVINVLANDSTAPDTGETLTVTAVTQPATGGTVTLVGGVVRFTPAANFSGTTTFTYTVSDGNGGTATATVTVTVTPVNDPPTAANDAVTVAEDSAATVVNVLANDSTAPDTGETLTVTAVTQPATGGTVTLVGGVVRFTPAANFSGTTTFTYTVSDGNGGTATATVTVTVTPFNDPPTAANDAVTVAEDSAATVVNVLANDTTAPDTGETLTVTAVTQPATGGTVTLTGGVVRFTPAANFSGTTTFTYTVSDGNGGTATATVTVTVTPVNDPPTAANDTFTVAENSAATPLAVLANDTAAPDTGETLTVTAVTQPATGGAVTLTGGVVRFTPAAGFNGTATFTYTVSDGNGGTATATVTVTVTAVNDPPTANADAATVAEDSAATVIDVLANDSTAPDTGETLTVTAVTQPATGGTVTLTGGVVRFTPAPNFFGTATFTYTISDGNGGTATATVTVTVTPVNDPPTAVADAASVPRDAPATVVDVLANDSIAPDTGETLTVTAVTQPATGGTVTLTGGQVRFQPTAGFVGTTTFTYTISDGNGGTATATVTMTVRAPDRDGDGISDDAETAGGSDPDDADTDDDGVIDGDEPMPYVDTDGDGLIDVRDPDSDNDGLFDGTELGVTTPHPDTDVGAGHFIPDGDAGATTTDPLDRDTDDGGVSDGAEDTDKDGVVDPGERDPNVPADDVTPPADDDMDGLTNAEEAELGTDPQDADSDDDGVLDGAEANYSDDTDGDGLINPLDPDSDNDGLFDGTEVGVTTPHPDTDVAAGHFRPDADPSTHTSMVDRDTDHGGVPDGAEDTDKDGQRDTGERDPLDPADDATPPTDDDMDGLTNAEEAELGTDPQDADSDDDGVIDGAEANYSDDTDGDGLINPLDPDSDNDGLFDGTESGVTTAHPDTDVGAGHYIPDADPSTHTGPLDPDTDDGGVPDGAEDVDHNGRIDGTETDPLDPSDDSTVRDDDGDGLSNPEEVALGTDPQDADSDDDGVLDGAEANYADDTDGDGMINPLDPDSDGDGITDGTEVGVTTPHPDTDVTAGHFTPDADPSTHTSMVVTDTDHGGVPDGEEDTDHDGQVDAGERDPLDPADDQPLDRDHDGVLDVVDNCPDTANPDQDDPDQDGLGSACDDDDDGDGFVDGYGVSGGGCSTSGRGGGGGVVVLGLAIAGVIVRRRRRVAAVAAVGLVALAPAASAQVASEKQDFSIERFELSSDTGGILGVEGAGLGARWGWDVHLWMGSANDPLVVYMDDGGRERVGALVRQRTGGELGASLVLHERIGFGVDAPLIVAQSRDAMVPGVVGTLPDVGGVGLGDLRLSPKLRLLRQGHEGVDLAVVPEVVLPTGAGENYRGDDGASFAPYLALSRRHARLRWAIDLGYAFRRQTGVGGLVVDDELRAKAGVGVQVVRRVELAATVSAATAAKAPFDDFARNHLELVGGPVATLGGGWQLFGAGGVGLREGYGTPDWRALGGLRVGVGDGAPVDWDHDGLIATDRCPRDPEDKDAFQDEDGCSDPDNDRDDVLDVADGAPMDPEDKDDFEDADGVPDPDNDQDGIADAGDDCPLVAENVNGFQDEDGCPDEKDSDGDGNPDTTDQCPTDPEDVDKFQDEDGCPEDNDGDGVPDATDACPTEPGPVDNQGCPDKDRDADTVVDRLDNCPDEPGTVANHGCKEKQLAVLSGGSIEILDVVYFKTNKDIIQKRSFKLLSSVAAIIANHPELPSITIEGHTDDRGDDDYNLDLSQRRAEAVRRFLIGKGIDGARLEAKGYGETQPLKPNDTNANRSANRRVEFKVGNVASANSGPTTDTMDKDPKSPPPGELP